MMTTSELYACMTLLTATLLHIIRADVEGDSGNVSPTLLQVLCGSDSCRNGECYVVNRQTRCLCQSIYRGEQCQYVNLDELSYAVIGSIVIFQWQRPPRIRNYAFVYYQVDVSETIIYKRTIHMRENEQSLLIGNLHGGRTRYRICIEDNVVAERVVSTQSVDLLSNCIELATQPDYHTLAAWCLLGLLSCVAVLLMYSQKNKIEILYFTTPAYIPKYLEDNLTAQELLQMTRVDSENNNPVSNGTTTTPGCR